MSIPAMFWAMKAQAPTPSSKLTLITLADCADHLGKCYPSLQYMQEVTGLSRSGVKKCMHQLAEANLIRVKATFKEGRQRCNTYYLCMDGGEGSLSNPPGGHTVTTEPVIGTLTNSDELDGKPSEGQQQAAPKTKEQEIRETIWSLVDKVGVKRSTLGQLMKNYGEAAVMQAVTTTIAKVPADPESFIRRLLKDNPEKGSKAEWEIVPSDDAQLDSWISRHGHKPARNERNYHELRQRLYADIKTINESEFDTPAEYWEAQRQIAERNYERRMRAAAQEMTV